jgi:histidinol-phosphate aminotransferase
MNQVNRRQWMRMTGLAGLSTLLSPSTFATNNPFPNSVDDQLIRLSSNENPYGPSPRVREAMVNAFEKVCRYPGRYSGELRDMLAEKHGVSKENILLVAGSTEGLKLCGLTYGSNGKEIVAADPVFKSLLSYAEHFGSFIHKVPVDDQLQHDLEGMEARITQNTGLVFVCNPGNPTGTLIPADKMRQFCSEVSERTMVFSDEAYFDYITEPNYPSMVELVKQDKNVVVSRTFSKVFGLAGIRVGYLIARPDIISRLGRSTMARPNILAIYAAIEALKDKEFYLLSLNKNVICKKIIYETLDDLKMEYQPSHANFVFFKTGKDISEVQEGIRKHGIAIGRAFPPLREWCRISTGRVEDVQQFCNALKKEFS